MMRTVVSSGNDALNILFEAAAAHSREQSANESGVRSENVHDIMGDSGNHRTGSISQVQSGVSPEVLAKAMRPVGLSHASREVLDVWEACRLVKMGWFTSKEAVTFIDLSVCPGFVVWAAALS